jgi:hypothetical protein
MSNLLIVLGSIITIFLGTYLFVLALMFILGKEYDKIERGI